MNESEDMLMKQVVGCKQRERGGTQISKKSRWEKDGGSTENRKTK